MTVCALFFVWNQLQSQGNWTKVRLNGYEALMAWKDLSLATFTGGSGQLAVMDELLHRKCNAAIPHVDVGLDVFAFKDDREEIARIQVKTALGSRYKKGMGYSAKFGVPMEQLRRGDIPELFYALAVRLEEGWGSFIVISRVKLKPLSDDGCGSKNEKSGDLELYIQFRPDEEDEEVGGNEASNERNLNAVCGTFDFTEYINAWESLPPLKPPHHQVPMGDEANGSGGDTSEVEVEGIGVKSERGRRGAQTPPFGGCPPP